MKADVLAGAIAFLTVAGFAFVTGIGAGFWVWQNAPPVGGEWWFYIRSVATIVSVFVGVKIGALIGWLVTVILGGALAVITS